MEPDTALTALARVLLYSDLPMQVIFEERQFFAQSAQSSYNVFAPGGRKAVVHIYGPDEDMVDSLMRGQVPWRGW